jgi:hypothetical protein
VIVDQGTENCSTFAEMPDFFRFTVAILFAAALVGCSGPDPASIEVRGAHVDACVQALQPLDLASLDVGLAMSSWLRGREADLEAIDGTFRALKKTIATARAEIEVSRKNKAAQVEDFDAAIDVYLDHLDELVQELDSLIAVIREHNPGDQLQVLTTVEAFEKFEESERKARERINIESGKIRPLFTPAES